MKKKLRQLIPWLIAAGIFYLLFKKIPPADVLATMKEVNWPLLVGYSVVYFAIIMLIDCAGLTWLLSRFSTRVTFKETFLMRGATYLLMIINYNLAQGGIAFYLRRTHKAPIFKTLGAMFYLTLLDLSLVLSFSWIALQIEDITYRGIHLRPYINRFAIIYYTALVAWIFFWRLVDHPVFRNIRKIRLVEWLLSHHLFVTFRESTGKDYLKAIAFRIPVMALIVVSFFLWINASRSSVPLSSILLYSPVIMIVSTLPITPAGIGTVQAMCIELFHTSLTSPLLQSRQLSADEILLAGSLAWGFVNIIIKVLLGFFCLRQKSRSLFEKI